MENKRFEASSRNHPAIRSPRGFSIIDHSIRYKLKLTVEEYIMADLIYQHNKSAPVGAMVTMNYFTSIGFEPENISRVGKSLREKGIVITDEIKKRPAISKLWTDNFDDDAQFEILWKIHNKGNKQEAKINFMKMKKMISFTALCEKLKHYVEYKTDDPIFLKDLSGWLNPKFKRWEDIVEYKGAEQKDKSDNDMPTNLFRK